MSKFAATDSLLGYLYQLRTGLLWALKRLKEGSPFLVSVETLDDVTFETPEGDATDVLQTKLHRNRDTAITDASVDFWKSLRIWIEGRKDTSIPLNTSLQLLTTATAPDASIASYLGVRRRDEDAALHAMENTVATTFNRENAAAFAAFNGLSNEERKALLALIVVIDQAPGTTTLDEDLKKEVYWAADRDDLESFLQRLEGWWFRRVMTQLNSGPQHRIVGAELETRMAELRNEFKRDDSLTDEDLSRRIPSVAGTLPRAALEEVILARLKASSYVVLQGMSGAGKTVLAAYLARGQLRTFDVIWYDARKLDRVEQLEAAAINHSKKRQSIASLLRTEQVLLVLDDPRIPLADLPAIDCGDRSRVVVTTQAEDGDHVVVVGDLDVAEALQVLTAGVPAPCPGHLPELIRSAVGGHPLTLRALNKLAATRGWKAVEDCLVKDEFDTLRDDRKQKIFERILERHCDDISTELEFVMWCRSSHFHEELADATCGAAISALRERGFLAATTPGYIRVHDLVYRAVDAAVDVSEKNDKRFRERLTEFVRREIEADRTLLQRVAKTQDELFRRLLSAHREPALVYMVALSRETAESIDLLGDPLNDAQRLVINESLEDRTLEQRAIIEASEALFTLRKEFRSGEEARKGAENGIEALALINKHPKLTRLQKRDLRHHRAKLLLRLDDGEKKKEAEQIFVALLDEDPSFAAARIQLAARFLGRDKAIAECEAILKQREAHPEQVSLNVLLETLRILAFYGADLKSHWDVLMSSIALASGVDRGEAMRLVSSVAQRAWFNAPDVIVPMLEALDLSGPLPSPSEAFDWGQVHKYAAIVTREQTRAMFLKDALRFYRLGKLKKEFERTHYAEALILSEQYAEARTQLESIAEPKQEAFWLQRHAQALSGLARHADALRDIEQALAKLKDQSLKPVFLADSLKLRKAAGEPAPADEYDAVIAALPEAHWLRVELEEEKLQAST